MVATYSSTLTSPDPNLSMLRPGTADTKLRRRALADSLIGTHYWPPFFTTIRMLALEAEAYHALRPYPFWQFSDWKTEDRGVLPRCLPLARRVVCKSAKWLFGRPIEIHMPGSIDTERFIREAWQLNRMTSRMVAAAERGGVEGGVVLKWSYDEESLTPLRFQVLSPITECRLFYDPHDIDDLLMARIQYPVFNPRDGETYLYREEWTDDWEVRYKPQRMTTTNIHRFTSGGAYSPYPVATVPAMWGSKTEPDLYEKWEIDGAPMPNKFGLIPLHQIRNSEALATFGRGDMWTDVTGGMFRLLDRVNLTYQGMDRHNQLYSDPTFIYIDAKAGPDVLDRPITPGTAISVKSDDGFGAQPGRQARAIMLETEAGVRTHMRDYARDLMIEVLSTVGSVDVDTSEVGNKGNLTEAVLTQLYMPLIETTEEKRKTYGEDGIAKFLERCVCGLANLGVKQVVGIDQRNRASYDVQLRWPDYFPLDDDAKLDRFARIRAEVDAGYMPSDRGIEIILQAEGIQDIPAAKEELEQQKKEMAAQPQTVMPKSPATEPYDYIADVKEGDARAPEPVSSAERKVLNG